MDINIKINNKEDIELLKNINPTHINEYICTCISIGLKSINMSQTVMTGNSYYEPIKNLIDDNNIMNNEKLDSINDMLQDILNIKNNSSKKGKLGETLAYSNLIKKYPDWIVTDTTGISHEGDFYMYSANYGKILYEIKTYNTNVCSKEVLKFKNDMLSSNSDHGIFISQTSGIANKKMFDIELYENKLLVYISNSGLNGHGIEIATEFLLTLIKIGYNTKQTIIKEDYNIKLIVDNINSKLLNCKECFNNFSRLKNEILRTQENINSSISLLYKHCLDYEYKSQITYEDLLKSIKLISNNNNDILNKDKSKIISIINKDNENTINILFDLCDKMNITYGIDSNNIIYLMNSDNVIKCKIIEELILKLYFPIFDTNININISYEYIENNNIVLKLVNIYDDNIMKIITNRLQ